MKVLVTGGYGFIGSHIAERFHKEGHDVVIIDNLSTGKREYINFKHKSHSLSIEDPKCEEIYRSNKFDIVVHMAAQVSVTDSIIHPARDAEANVSGLINMLNLSRSFNVTKFIYASSAAVYGVQQQLPIREDAECSPLSPYGMSKLSGERYARKWQEWYGLETLGFRFSNVYGPRQSVIGEGGVVTTFLNRAIAGQDIVIHGDGSQTRDFIYVEDVADVIYRASLSGLTGVYNVSTGTECSVKELVDYVQELQPVKKITYGESRSGDIERSVLSNDRVQRELDWSPLYSIAEGLQRTFAYFQSQQAAAEAATAKAERASSGLMAYKPFLKQIQPYGENLLAFGLTAWLTLNGDVGGGSVIDVKLFYITIMGILYGNKQAIMAVMLSIGLYIFERLQEGNDFISLLYITDFFFQIAIYLFIGLVVGYSIERKNNRIEEQQVKIAELEDKHEFLNGVYHDVREVKEELQLRILNAGDSYGKLYSITKELESLEPEKVFTATVNVVKSIMSVPYVSIYTVNRDASYLRLVASSGMNGAAAANSIKVTDHAYISAVIHDGEMFVNKHLVGNAPLMCAPIYDKGMVSAVVMIDGLPFEKFSLYHQNLFKTTVDLVSSALSKAFAFTQATEDQRYIAGTPLLRDEVFQEIVASKRLALKEHHTPYLILRSDGGDDAAHIGETSRAIAAMLRETDYIGRHAEGPVLVLLSGTSREDAGPVMDRFARRGISLTLAEEDQ
ncbi:GDP-mannose 4,6-dehydratase [Paenibacillus sp. J5C_2022]|uniref:NAD-dependent epimerase/dehydratase family protein n=1 Tax=Paenibacillus sp. J5C2022 TaxID=2977129 RepID=UPI0021D0982D|nr:NAD-dependent epimerase/dehydratase family protein [Paenibacillus sp. J5C2022]MCU6710806.1 GDP-mannose 4,6-dehydratase [Paenibacillus sp. J5C2022]